MKILGAVTIFSLALLGIILNQTSPSTITPLGILFVFLLFYTSTLGVVTFFLYFGSRLLQKLAAPVSRIRFRILTLRESYLFGSVLAIAPIILLAMQSVEAIGLADIGLILLFELLACFYIWRRI